MMTAKAMVEVNKLKGEVAALRNEVDGFYKKSHETTDIFLRKSYRKEAVRLDNQSYKKEAKIAELEKLGISTLEMRSLKKEASDFTTIKYDRSLGSRDSVRVGYSKTLQSFVKVEMTRWSGFMSNVRGCGSLANTTDLNRFEYLTQEQASELLKQDRVGTTSFAGATQVTVTPAI